MVDEVKMKRMERRIDEIHDLVNHSLEKGVHIPDDIRVEHRELVDEYNAMLSKIHQQKSKELIEKISKEE